ncbi:MAG: prolyl oligopeptidase family serine peptidase [Candidatus Limnocylindrales bacterium]
MQEADWRRRYSAPRVTLPEWADEAPDRLVYASNSGGRWELYAWDRSTDSHRQITDRREGTLEGWIAPDGQSVWWSDDTDGDEFGHWVVDAFDGSSRRIVGEELGRAYPTGLNIGRSLTVFGGSTDEGSSIHVVRNGGAAEQIYRHREESWLGGISADEKLICFHHSEHGDSRHPDLRVVDASGATVAELSDGPDVGLAAFGFPLVEGDDRVLVLHERRDLKRPLIWWPHTGETREIELDLPGDVDVSWYPDGRAILVTHEHAGRSSLHRYDIEASSLEEIPTPSGVTSGASARPDGEVWYQWSDSASPAVVRSTSGEVVLKPKGETAPAGVRYSDLFVGDVHALVAEAPGPRPHPTIFVIHGGPEAHDRDSFSPPVQAWVDHGLAVVMINYRGSTGYGRKWRDAITGNPGLTELADIAAVHDRVVADGIADPQRIVLSGGSWGGYLTLLGMGTQPELWSLGVAAVPVADYVAAFEDEMEPLKAYDRALFGASPHEDLQLYVDRSPLTFIENVRVPVMILAGANDPRCPIRQIDNYIERLSELGKPHEVMRFDAGHGSLRTAERIRQMEGQIDFVARHLGTTPPL